MMKSYEGALGKFEYDTDMWLMHDDYLTYMGTEIDGSKIQIPEGINDCTQMFCGCAIKTAPKIPEGVVTCKRMFAGCYALETPPAIPEGVVDCGYMFHYCSKLEYPSNIPDSAESCYSMFAGCESLKTAPVYPKNEHTTFDRISEDVHDIVDRAFDWNYRHRGKNYSDWYFNNTENTLSTYFSKDFLVDSKSDLPLMQSLVRLTGRYTKSNKAMCYKHIIDGISSGVISTLQEINDEMEIADKVYKRTHKPSNNLDLHNYVEVVNEHQGLGGRECE